MKKRKKKNRVVAVGFLLGLLGLTGCMQALETASDKFDGLVSDVLAGQDTYSDSENVSVRILTATPVPDETVFLTPGLTSTPTPQPANVEPKGEETDEQVYASSAVNIRAGWSVDYSIVGSLQKNDQVHRVAVLENGWSKISYNSEYAYVNSSYLTTERPPVVGTVHLDTAEYTYESIMNGEDVVVLGVQNILQKPDLPAGPEITCLAIVLNYMEEYVDKVFLAENYLMVAEPGEASPYEAYIGDPKVAKISYGCYAPVIVDAANRYFSDKGISGKQAVDVSGSTMEQLLEYVKNGTPVIVWGTTNLAESKVTAQWEVDGELFQWRDKEHCTVLIGYNKNRSTVIVADPLQGIVEFDMDKYYKRYTEQVCSAVVIR